jgi:hypothetical protein
MDWDNRKEELFHMWFNQRNISFDNMVDEIITQEQSLIQEAEEEKKELINALRKIRDHKMIYEDLDELIEKYQEK